MRYYDYEDLQIAQLFATQTVTQNAAQATVWGLEAEFVALPRPEFVLVASFGYLDATFDEFVGFLEEDITLTPMDFSGNRLVRAPKYSLTLAAEYGFDLGRFGRLAPRIQFYASDDVFYRASNFDSDKQDNYTKTDVRLTWRSESGRVSVEGFVENLTDEDTIQSKIVGSRALGAPIQTALDRPRVAGVRVGLRW